MERELGKHSTKPTVMEVKTFVLDERWKRGAKISAVNFFLLVMVMSTVYIHYETHLQVCSYISRFYKLLEY